MQQYNIRSHFDRIYSNRKIVPNVLVKSNRYNFIHIVNIIFHHFFRSLHSNYITAFVKITKKKIYIYIYSNRLKFFKSVIIACPLEIIPRINLKIPRAKRNGKKEKRRGRKGGEAEGEHLRLTRADRAGWIDNRESEMIRGGWHEIETRPRR